jgi:O-antigen/teichoic acid export membrane protein
MALNQDIAPKGNLKARIFVAGSWNVAQLIFSHIMRLLSNLVMTRLLVPEAFGLIAMVVTLNMALTLFTDIGIQRSIIREEKGDDPHFLRVAWVVQIIRSSFIALMVVIAGICLLFLGPIFAIPGTVYADPTLPWLIMVSSLSVLMLGMESTNKALAFRRMQFGRLTIIEIGTKGLGILAMIAFANIERSAWALLFGMLTSSFLGLFASHIYFLGPKMAVEWDRVIVDKLWQFGKWLIGSSGFHFIATNTDRLVLAGLLGKEIFGIYVIATIWIGAGKIVISKLISDIGFATLSELMRERPHDVPRLFRRIMLVIDGLCVFSFLAFFIFGQMLINLLYTSEYSLAGEFISILALMFLILRYDAFGLLILSSGDSKSIMIISFIRAVSICVLLPTGYYFVGMEGVLMAVALSPILSIPFVLWRVAPLLNFKIKIDVLWLILICCVAVVVYLARF